MRSFMYNLKSIIDFQSKSPFWLINKESAVPSWFGALATILSFILALILCLSDIKEVFLGNNPNVREDFFDPTSDSGFNATIPFDQSFNFNFGVYSRTYRTFLNEDYFTPGLYLGKAQIGEDDQYFKLDLYKCPKYNGLPIFCISPNQTEVSKEDMKIFLSKKQVSFSLLYLSPCQNSSEPNSKICANEEDIDEALKDVEIIMSFRVNDYNLYRDIKGDDSAFIANQDFRYFTSMDDPVLADFTYGVQNYTEITPFANLAPLFFSPNNWSISTFIGENEQDSFEYGSFFVSWWGFDYYYISNDYLGEEFFTADATLFTITYKSIPDILASIMAMKDLFLWLIPFILDKFGYLEGNYYSEVIHSFFGENEKYSLTNRKKIIHFYDKGSSTFNELFPIPSSINDDNSNSAGVKEQLIKPRGIIFSRVNKIWDGTITSMFKFCCCCSYCKSQKWKENNEIYSQAKKVIENYTDIIFYLKKMYEYERMKKDNTYIKPKLIKGITNKEEDENFYTKWLNAQKDPIYGSNELSDFPSITYLDKNI